jgi:hypothetical protein
MFKACQRLNTHLGIIQKAAYTIFEISVLLRGLEVPGLPDKWFQSSELARNRGFQSLPGGEKGFRLAKDQGFQGLL